MFLRPAYPVRSARLLLRPLGETDAEELLSYRSLPEVCRWVPFEPMCIEEINRRLRGAWAAHTVESQGDSLVLGVELAATGELVGDVMLRLVSEEQRGGEIGYVFNPAYSGHGYAGEAAHTVLRLGFEELGLHRMVARVAATNVASARVARRLGMRQEAHLVEHEWFKGEWGDEFVFALLDREWSGASALGVRR